MQYLKQIILNNRNKKIGFLITARLKSTRLKLKILKNLNGYTVIDRVINRAKLVNNCDEVILCTSYINQDLPLVRCAQENNTSYFIGHPDDVLDRLNKACQFYGLDYAVCMTADNPLFSINFSNKIVEKFLSNPDLDYIYTEGLPIGLNPYGLSAKALKTICAIKVEVDTEIWGPLFLQSKIFNLFKFQADKSIRIPVKRLTLDEELDYELLNEIFNQFDKDYIIDESDLENLFHSKPELLKINSSVNQKSIEEKQLKRIKSFFNFNREKILRIKQEIYSKK